MIKAIKKLRAYLRVCFLAGIFLALPVMFTVVCLVWIWSKINTPLKEIFNVAATQEQMPWSDIGEAIKESDYNRLFIPLISAALVLLTVLLLGMLTRSIIGRIVLNSVENVVARMPVIGLLYTSFKQFREAFVTTDGESKFKRVVAVQFPYKNCWSIGFVTGNAVTLLPQLAEASREAKSELLSVVVPSTPFPTTSFMVMVPEIETITLNIEVKDALKLIISGGAISPVGHEDKPEGKPEGKLTRIIRESNNQKQ
ncbi:MAG: DUF502 domain-containing protein [Planctomycetota bacterium]